VLLALFQIFSHKLTPDIFVNLYSFIPPPSAFNTSFLGLINLEQSSILMVGLAAIAQFSQGRMMLPKIEKGKVASPAEAIGRNMVYLAPILTLIFFWKLPAAMSLYWMTSTIFTIFQQKIINAQLKANEESGSFHKKNN
jgi:membrane protein insertase Oxa1/YidC/SpoIIIJ